MFTLFHYNHIRSSQRYSMREITQFLNDNGLSLDERVTDFIEVRDGETLIACGGLDGAILKCIAISPEYRGEGVALKLLTELVTLAHQRGASALFLYTKPDNQTLFAGAGFFPLAYYEDKIVLMENSATRLHAYCDTLRAFRQPGEQIAAIVMNANPFTLGHRYLVETAAAQSDWVHLFLVKEDASQFSYETRLQLVQLGCADLSNVTVHQGSDYIISKATFPNYFLKNKAEMHDGFTAIDLTLFRQAIAPALGITHRFVGEEPLDAITQHYNREMQRILTQPDPQVPPIKVVECPRKQSQGEVISASRVRAALAAQNYDLIATLVPPTTLAYLLQQRAQVTPQGGS